MDFWEFFFLQNIIKLYSKEIKIKFLIYQYAHVESYLFGLHFIAMGDFFWGGSGEEGGGMGGIERPARRCRARLVEKQWFKRELILFYG